MGPKDMLSSIALMNAAGEGNAEIVKMLLDRGANVNAASPPIGGEVKNGPIALGNLTPLLFAAAFAPPETIKLLLDAGADVNARDMRGMTPLMLAVSSDHPDPRVIRMLIAKGADPKIKSKNGESAFDWAKKYSYPPVLEALGVPEMRAATNPAFIQASDTKMPGVKQATEKSIALLQRASAGFFTEGGCVGCHAQNLTGIAIAAARRNGFKVDEAHVSDDIKALRLQWSSFEQPLLQRGSPPEVPEIVGYSLVQMAAENAPPDHATDAMIHNAAKRRQLAHRSRGQATYGGRRHWTDRDLSSSAAGLWIRRTEGRVRAARSERGGVAGSGGYSNYGRPRHAVARRQMGHRESASGSYEGADRATAARRRVGADSGVGKRRIRNRGGALNAARTGPAGERRSLSPRRRLPAEDPVGRWLLARREPRR